MEQKKLTGYPSIDKPWLKYYSDEAINAPLPEGSLYEYMTRCNIGREQETALIYFGKRITHQQLQSNIERCAKALVSCGVKKGDFVCLCLLTIPEAAYLLYAVNRIGAVCNFLVLNASEHDLHEQMAVCKSKLVIAMDMVIPRIIAASRGTEIKHIVSLSVADSMPLPMSVLLRMKSKSAAPSQNVCPWKTFLQNGASSKVPDVQVNADDPAHY